MTRKMKDSGVEWIGEIPEDWEVVKLKSITKSHYSGGTPTASKEEFYSEDNIKGFSFVNISDITDQKYITSTAKNITIKGIENKNLKLVPKGSLLYAMYASVGKLSVSQIDLYISQAILAFDATEKADKRYLVYYLNSLESFVDYFSSGTTQMNLNAEIVKNFKVVIPSLKIQQKAIADFLDKKTQEIDNIISKTKKAIEEYKRYKQSLITETVTKGLDKNVEMKDSGIEWIGEIPKHWEITKLKYYLKNVYNSIRVGPFGSQLKTSDYKENGKWVYNQRTVLDKNINTNDTFISNNKFEDLEGFQVEKDDILITTRGSIGKIFKIPNNHPLGIIHPCIIKFKLNEELFSYRLLELIFNSSNFAKNQFSILSNSTTIDVIYSETLRNIRLPLIPLKEQEEIASYLDKKTNKIDQIISSKEKLLTEMEAYKKSLIYETVTGKREVE